MHGGGSKLPDLQVDPSGSLGALPVGVIETAFPFHLWMDDSLRVTQVGRSLRRAAPDLVAGTPVFDSLALVEPAREQPTLAELRARTTEAVMLELRATGLRLRGQILALGDQLVFLVEPWVCAPEQLDAWGLSRAELPVNVRARLDASCALLGQVEQQRRALLESEHRIATHLRHMPLGVIDWDTEGRVAAWNPAAETIFGVAAADALGRGVEVLAMVGPVHADVGGEGASDEPGFELLASLDRRVVVEHRPLGRTPLLCAWHNTRLVDLDGRVIGVSSILRDVTASVRSERSVREAQKLESLGLFAGGIAHDFNNLLAGLVGNTDLALLEVSPKSSVARHLREISSIAERATDLTKQLLEFSGRATPELEPVSMAELVMQVRGLLAVTLPSRIRLVVEQPGEPLPEISGDLGRLRQVIGNLVINAAEAIASERSGEIRLSLEVVTLTVALDEPTVRGGPIPPGSYLRLSVRDDGEGIPPELLSRIFDPFFTTKFTGRGLGLAAILGIVRSHHGALRVESTPGQGTCFELYFPCLGPSLGSSSSSGLGPRLAPNGHPALASRLRPDGSSPAARLGRLLIVDDEAQVRRVLTTALARAGFDVIAAAAGSIALELYDSDPEGFDLVLTDLTMPGLDGHELFCQLTARDPGLPIILSSGYSDHQGTTCYPDGTPATFLKKPYRLGYLLAKVHEELDKRGCPSPPRTA
jgi:two-component system, cell cycle sensor histidine kinase and response regulator CckA